MDNSFRDDTGAIINFYDILNLPYDAGREAVRSSFCSLIKKYHTDRSGINTEEERKKINLIINGYKILSDESLRNIYDGCLFDEKNIGGDGYVRLPNRRVHYSFSLQNLIKTRLLNRRMRRRDRIFNIGQDIEIIMTPSESRRGAIAMIELPVRVQCPLCFGGDAFCSLCNGIGRISSTSRLEIRIPPGTADSTLIDVDLMKFRPDSLSSFTMKNLRLRIRISGDIPL